MELAEAVGAEIERWVAEDPGNRRPDGGPYFDPPLAGFASADDPLFDEFQRVIGSFHWTPQDAFEGVHGRGTFPGGTVISWVLPVAADTREENRAEGKLPSRLWAHTRAWGEAFNDRLRRGVVAFLAARGARAVAPVLAPGWARVDDPRVGMASTWSERHAAYVAGLGTFSLNDGLITPKGIAHRLGSVVTEASLPPTPRPYRSLREYCGFFNERGCAACVARCPAGAISGAGHDKERCRHWSYDVALAALGARYEVGVTGCGLCQVGVPCEAEVPR